ncbi:S8 family peptidase [candidate division KSB1 bacterium]|nr:S8 family peptidase [candidate division KSB1 bacterium]
MMLSLATLAGARVSDQWATCEYLTGRMIVDLTVDIGPRIPALDQSGIVQLGLPEFDALCREFEVSSCFRLVPDESLDRLRVPPDLYRTYVLIFRAEYPVLNVIDRFAEVGYVNFAMPDLLYRADRTPNDPRWNSQYDKRIMGEDLAWDISTGSRDIIVAGIDTGVDWNHPDLALDPAHPELWHILWVNPDEDLDSDDVCYDYTDYPGDTEDINGWDDGENGYEDDFLGWDFIRNIGGCASGEDCDANMDNDMFGMEAHGTHVAGIMACHGNNGVGCAGASWVGRLMCLRAGFLNSQGNGLMPESATTPAIVYAAANGAKIINMSYGGPGFSSPQQQALNSAWAQGCMNFGASGNDGVESIHYPAGYENVIAVNATDQNDVLASWSNRGTWTEMCAPGVSIMSTVIDGYQAYDGTSMASPNAGGCAALIWSIFPTLTNAELRDLMFETCEDISDENPSIQPPTKLGHGRASARNAIAQFFPRLSLTDLTVNDASGGDSDGRLESGESGQVVLTCANEAGWADGVDITMIVTSGDPNVSVSNGEITLGNVPAGQSINNQSNPVVLTIGALELNLAYDAELSVEFEAPNGYHQVMSTTVRLGRASVLLVDDDVDALYDVNYGAGLTDAAVSWDVWHANLDGAVTDVELMHYTTVLWSCGDDSLTSLTAAEQTGITNYLNAGRNLILAGQYIDEDLRDAPFYADVLHAQSEQLNGDRRVLGATGNPISDGLSLLLQGSCSSNGQRSPSRILPTNGGEELMDYQNGGIAAVSYSGAYKLAYFAFALEAACGNSGTDSYGDVLQRVLTWMEVQDVPADRPGELPSSVELHGNYPNPFNPTTTIEFALPSAAHVKLTVFDVLGRDVATLVDDALTAGMHRLEFNGTNLASGVYFARLEAGSVVQSAKMVLMK